MQFAPNSLPNTSAAAVIPLKSYLQKYATQLVGLLVPAISPPPVVGRRYECVQTCAFSVLPLLGKAVSPYYAGVFDDDTDFSASLIKVAAMFAAGQLSC